MTTTPVTTATINLAARLGEDVTYVDDDSRAAIEALPDAAWQALLDATDDLSGGDDPGISSSVAVTRETLADFDDSRRRFWAEKGSRVELTCGGLPAVKYERFQLRRGATRRTQIVIDCGDLRAAVM